MRSELADMKAELAKLLEGSAEFGPAGDEDAMSKAGLLLHGVRFQG